MQRDKEEAMGGGVERERVEVGRRRPCRELEISEQVYIPTSSVNGHIH